MNTYDDRRVFSRQRLDGDVLLRHANTHKPLIRAQVFDIAAEGISLHTTESIDVGTPVELMVKVHDPVGQFMLHGVIAWCRTEGREFRVGIELGGAQSEDDWTDWRALFID